MRTCDMDGSSIAVIRGQTDVLGRPAPLLEQLPALQRARPKIGRQGGPHQAPSLPRQATGQGLSGGQGQEGLPAHQRPLLGPTAARIPRSGS